MYNYIEIEVNSLNEFLGIDEYFLTNFVFRGQYDSTWSLSPSIERHKSIEGQFSNYKLLERQLLDEFKRKYPLHSDSYPDYENDFEWLAILQHHGGPTRLIDFTYSKYIALYFALVNYDKNEDCENAAVWGVKPSLFHRHFENKYKRAYATMDATGNERFQSFIPFVNEMLKVNSLKDKQIDPFVLPIVPKHAIKRLLIQQGLFLIPSNNRISFMDNMKQCLANKELKIKRMNVEEFNKYIYSSNQTENIENSTFDKVGIIKIIIAHRLFLSVQRFFEQANITAETLFPGVDGLVRSLKEFR